MPTSTPPLDRADLLSLIVFNQPLNQMSEGQQISMFEINLAPEQGGGPNVTIGERISQNLYLKVEQRISDANQMNVILGYELTNWLCFRTNVVQGVSTQQAMFQRVQDTGADLLFFFSY